MLQDGGSWQVGAKSMFGGQGSFGNGAAAMRVAPLDAYFADDLERVAQEARLSAEVTHNHPEGVAGGIAAAVATAVAARLRGELVPTRRAFIDTVLPHVPKGLVYDNMANAEYPTGVSVNHIWR